MALTAVDQTKAGAAAEVSRDGRRETNGRTHLDAAHVGPLPEATFPELIGRFINDVSALADRQIELAKQELAESKDAARSAFVRIAIGAGIAAAAALLVIIWAWTAVIWFFNWVGAFVTIGAVTLSWLGWVVGVLAPALAAFIAYQRFIRSGINQSRQLWPPLARTRATLEEDLEWVRQQRRRKVR